MKIVFTYYTNEGQNLLCNFRTEESFLSTAKKSVCAAREYISEMVVIYTDKVGEEYLSKHIEAEYVVVDYAQYNFPPTAWNFPKLISYALQESAFIHLDFDFIIESKPTNLDNEIVTENINQLTYLSGQLSFLPQSIRDHYSPNNICSGLIGGTNTKVFKKLLEVASKIITSIKEPRFIHLHCIEEVVLTAICKRNKIAPVIIDCDFTHYQSADAKSLLAAEEVEDLSL